MREVVIGTNGHKIPVITIHREAVDDVPESSHCRMEYVTGKGQNWYTLSLQNQHMITGKASLSKKQTAARKEKVLVLMRLIRQNKAKVESFWKQNDIGH